MIAWGIGREISDVRYRTWGIRHEVSDMRYRTWGIGREVSDVRYRTWGIGREVSDMRYRTWGIGHEVSDIRYHSVILSLLVSLLLLFLCKYLFWFCSPKLKKNSVLVSQFKICGQRSIAYQGPPTWNYLPFDLRHKDSSSTFKSVLKTHLFHQLT